MKRSAVASGLVGKFRRGPELQADSGLVSVGFWGGGGNGRACAKAPRMGFSRDSSLQGNNGNNKAVVKIKGGSVLG